MEPPELEKIWKAVLGEIEVDLGKGNYRLYFYKTSLSSLEQGVAKINFKNKAVADLVNTRYYALIQNVLQKITKITPLSLVFEWSATAESKQEPEEIGPLFSAPSENKQDMIDAIKRCHLRLDFTFENFCVSTSNQLAFAAATATAQNPGKNYNPLFLWGGVGIGKTHLMQAVGHEILRKNPRAKIIYAPGEQFTNEIIAGIRSKNTAEFKNRYRSADALLIDDIQFLSGKDTAQEEFFHTFNAIQQNDGQIVMTSDRKPSDIPDLADRLRSRFEGGMVADISTPDSELKTAICMSKAKNRGIELSQDLAFSIASNVDNIRSLEGILQQIIILAQTRNQPVNQEIISQVLKIPVKAPESFLDARIILEKVCEYYNLPMKLIKGEKRDKPIVFPRQVTMYLLKKKTRMTLDEIGDYLGGRDHTTIMHGIEKVEELTQSDQIVKNQVDKIVDSL